MKNGTIAVLAPLLLVAGCPTVVNLGDDLPDAGGAGGSCEPGMTAPCYTGPAGTEGIGLCRAGTGICSPDGSSQDACEGSILPAPENCVTPEDEDCDGSAPPCEGTLFWGKRFGAQGDQTATALAVDEAGNIFITGTFDGTVDFGGGPLVSAGGGDIFLAKLTPSGEPLWSKSFGDASGPQVGTSIAVDHTGAVLIVGQYTGTIDFGSVPLESYGGSDVFLAKFDTEGGPLWSSHFSNFATNVATSIATDGANNVVISTTSNGVLVFGGDGLNAIDGFDVFVAKLDADGEHVWSQRFGGPDDQYGQALAVTAAGDVTVSASFLGSMDFGGGTLMSAGGQDLALARLNADGDHVWSQRFGSAGDQTVRDGALDPAGHLVTAGSFAGALSFGADPLVSSGETDVFLAMLDGEGSQVWSKRFGDPAPQAAGSVAVDGAGNILVAGHFSSQVDFGGGKLVSAGGDDVFLVKLAADGSHVWSKSFGDLGEQREPRVAVDGAGNVVILGSFPGSVDFGGGPLANAGGKDIFLAKFSP